MKQALFLIILFGLGSSALFSQEQRNPATDLLADLAQPKTEEQKLLPEHMLFTQIPMWGERGVMRRMDRFTLTPANRQKELKLRRTMLGLHQAMGFVTLATMAAQGIVGQKLFDGQTDLKELHEGLAGATNLAYFSTASLALFTPPKMTENSAGYSSIKLHKILAILHFSSMVATNVLAGLQEDDASYRPYHRAAALTAFGALTASLVILKF